MNQALLEISIQVDNRNILKAMSQEIDKTAAPSAQQTMGLLQRILSPGTALKIGAEGALVAARDNAYRTAYVAHPKVDVMNRASEMIGRHRKDVHNVARNMSDLNSRQMRMSAQRNKILQRGERMQSSYQKKWDSLESRYNQLAGSPLRQKFDEFSSRFGLGLKDRMLKTRTNYRNALNNQQLQAGSIEKQISENKGRLSSAAAKYTNLTTSGREEVIGNLRQLRNEASAPRRYRRAIITEATAPQRNTYEFTRRMEKPINYLARAGLVGAGTMATVGGISMARNSGRGQYQQQAAYQPQMSYQPQQPQQYYQQY